MKNVITFILVYTVMFLLVSCSKKDSGPTNVQPNNNGNNNPQQPALTEDEKFLVGDWVFDEAIDSLYPKASTGNKPSGTIGIIVCKMDDVYHLRADKKYTKEEGKDTCKSRVYGEQDWAIISSATNSIMTFADGPVGTSKMFSNTFEKIDNNHFSLRWNLDNWDGTHVSVYFFKRK